MEVQILVFLIRGWVLNGFVHHVPAIHPTATYVPSNWSAEMHTYAQVDISA